MKRRYYKILINNSIYKETNDGNVFLKVTPWEKGEDRRMTTFYLNRLIKNGNAVPMSFKDARNEMNERWNNVGRKWIFDGVEYKTIPNDEFHFNKVPPHSWYQKWIDNRGHERQTEYRYYLCMFQGKIYWITPSSYHPQYYLIPFKGIDIQPNGADGGQWTRLRNVRPIYAKKPSENYEWKPI